MHVPVVEAATVEYDSVSIIVTVQLRASSVLSVFCYTEPTQNNCKRLKRARIAKRPRNVFLFSLGSIVNGTQGAPSERFVHYVPFTSTEPNLFNNYSNTRKPLMIRKPHF